MKAWCLLGLRLEGSLLAFELSRWLGRLLVNVVIRIIFVLIGGLWSYRGYSLNTVTIVNKAVTLL